ncbi:MAG TPA: hypothetical protein VJB11_03100 [archaeon]|nr:hypothetical protein [archaeon]
MHIIRLAAMPKMLMNASHCPECGSSKFYHGKDEVFCLGCSMVIVKGK